jgi:Putative peptidoglycan binding domain
MTEGRLIFVPQGECIESIAHRAGLLPATIWDHPENAGLKNERGDHCILEPGDEVFVPAVREREERRATEARHTFRRKLPLTEFRVVLRRDGKPRGDVAFTLDVDGVRHEGRTDSDGGLRVAISPLAVRGQLVLSDAPDDVPIEIWFRFLSPVDTPLGAQQRLENLGYLLTTSSEEWTDEATQALSAFQVAQSVRLTGLPDRATLDALVAAHGS